LTVPLIVTSSARTGSVRATIVRTRSQKRCRAETYIESLLKHYEQIAVGQPAKLMIVDRCDDTTGTNECRPSFQHQFERWPAGMARQEGSME
jgi:hypothetical protein